MEISSVVNCEPLDLQWPLCSGRRRGQGEPAICLNYGPGRGVIGPAASGAVAGSNYTVHRDADARWRGRGSIEGNRLVDMPVLGLRLVPGRETFTTCYTSAFLQRKVIM